MPVQATTAYADSEGNLHRTREEAELAELAKLVGRGMAAHYPVMLSYIDKLAIDRVLRVLCKTHTITPKEPS